MFGGGLTGLIAGCTGGDEGETPTPTMNPTQTPTQTPTSAGCPDPPHTERDPKTLLPETPGGWEQKSWSGQAAGMVGAEEGVEGVYTNPDENEYTVEIFRWPSEEEAEDGVSIYRGTGEQAWQVWLVLGRFTFAANGPAEEPARTLLAASPALTPDCVATRG